MTVVEGGLQCIVEVHSIGELSQDALEQPRVAARVLCQRHRIYGIPSEFSESLARFVVEWTQVEPLGEVERR